MLQHTKSLEISNIPSWKCPILEYFHKILLDVSEYAKTLIYMSVSTKGLICHGIFT